MIRNLGDDVMKSMSGVYAGFTWITTRGGDRPPGGTGQQEGYRWWERNLPDSYLLREIDAMIEDSDQDNNYFGLRGGF